MRRKTLMNRSYSIYPGFCTGRRRDVTGTDRRAARSDEADSHFSSLLCEGA